MPRGYCDTQLGTAHRCTRAEGHEGLHRCSKDDVEDHRADRGEFRYDTMTAIDHNRCPTCFRDMRTCPLHLSALGLLAFVKRIADGEYQADLIDNLVRDARAEVFLCARKAMTYAAAQAKL